MTNDKIMHFYLRTNERRPVGVVVLRREGDGDLRDDGSPMPPQIRVAISLCHPNDQWNAERGITAATARLSCDRPYRSDTVGIERLRSTGKKPLLLNVALGLKPHGTAAKDQSVGIDWKLAQGIFERSIDYLLDPKEPST